MRKKVIISILCICLFCLIISIIWLIILKNKTNNSLNINQNDNINNFIFKDLSFIKNVNASSIANSIYNQKYILDNNIIYDLDGKILFDGSSYDYIRKELNYFIVEKNNKKGVINEKFEVVIPLEYYDVEIKSDKCIFLKTFTDNSMIITNIYNPLTKNEFGPFSSSDYYNDNFIVITKVGSNDIYFLNIQTNELIINDENNDYSWTMGDKFQEDYIILSKFTEKGFKKGVINYKGKEFIPFIYDEIANIENKYLLAKTDGSYILLDINNKEILKGNDIIDIIVYNDIIEVEKSDENYDYFYNGNIIYSTNSYSTIDYIGDNKYLLDNDNKCNYVDVTSNNIINEIDYSFCDGLFNTSEDGKIIKQNSFGETLYNSDLKQIFKNDYERIILFKNFCIVEENNLYKILSYNEELLLENFFNDYHIISDTEILLVDQNYNKYYFKN